MYYIYRVADNGQTCSMGLSALGDPGTIKSDCRLDPAVPDRLDGSNSHALDSKRARMKSRPVCLIKCSCSRGFSLYGGGQSNRRDRSMIVATLSIAPYDYKGATTSNGSPTLRSPAGKTGQALQAFLSDLLIERAWESEDCCTPFGGA